MAAPAMGQKTFETEAIQNVGLANWAKRKAPTFSQLYQNRF